MVMGASTALYEVAVFRPECRLFGVWRRIAQFSSDVTNLAYVRLGVLD